MVSISVRVTKCSALWLVFLTINSSALFGQAAKKKFWTYPMPAKITATSPLKAAPAFAVPDPIEAYQFKVNEPNPKKPVGKVQIYDFDFRGRRIVVGQLDVGQEVKPESVRRFANYIYYSFKFNDKTAWINGQSLEVAGYVPVVK